ncbi:MULTISPECIES: tetratricopeptide repeat protein [unclassified Crossiella]|uniref:AfsR/SARP family transcriptional regulator n=1 Tax=unclassified Crossiella TaxID=2620835 RepID=UPI001FFE4F7A|nr:MULTISPECIES: tetratricopeptide repeat protein [unclassified Crossiella]MCK2243484.1 tetratricopeptide repeat protein [Crossiella sp. S99.2]MCK2257342.1 tetratricopeptide repeat protein [Crossiella sp. S99.1]
MTVEFQVLGSVEARAGGRLLDLGPARQRRVLAALLVEANQAVTTDQLIDRVWGERLPQRAAGTLRSYLTRLRTILTEAGDVGIQRRSGGYVLAVDEQTVDLHRFRHLLAKARASTEDADQLTLFEQAFELWRGEAFADLDTPWFTGVRATLDRELVAAELDHADIALRQGRHSELLPRLSAQAERRPLDERLAGQVMVALYRGGRQAEALQAFHHIRTALIEGLGIEPGAELRALHQRILAGDSALAAPAPDAPEANWRLLPRDIDDFTGRDAELDLVLDRLPAVPGASSAVVITAIDGMAGVGKTALAIRAAHQIADRYPDAQLFLDLHAHAEDHQPTDPAAALDSLLRSVGVPGEKIPHDLQARAGLWRKQLAGRKALLVLDNAASAAQVRPLLPGNPECLVLITSRNRLTDLEAAHILSLDVLPDNDATALFARIAGPDRAAAEPAAVAEVVALCGQLPLAIRIAAARLRSRPKWTVEHLATRLRDERRRLGELATGDSGVAAAFALSYQQLTPAQQRLFRLLGLHPGADFDSYAAAALTEDEEFTAETGLEDLLDVHLLQQQVAGRYRFHDLCRAHARQLLGCGETEEERQAALGRLCEYYRHTTATAMNALVPVDKHLRPDLPAATLAAPELTNRMQAAGWLEHERANLITTATHGLPEHAAFLSAALQHYLNFRGYYDDGQILHRKVIDLAHSAGDGGLEGQAQYRLGYVYWWQGRYPLALTHLQRGLELAETAGLAGVQGYAQAGLGFTHRRLGRHEQALVHFQRALALAEQAADLSLQGHVLTGLGHTYPCVGRAEQAVEHLRRAVALAESTGDRQVDIGARIGLGAAYRGLGRYDQALAELDRALSVAKDTGDRGLHGYALRQLGDVCLDTGDLSAAGEHYQQALTLARAIGSPGHESEALVGLGETARCTGMFELALDYTQRAEALAGEVGDQFQQAVANRSLARTQHGLGRHREAREHWQRALDLFTELGMREADDIRGELAKLDVERAE